MFAADLFTHTLVTHIQTVRISMLSLSEVIDGECDAEQNANAALICSSSFKVWATVSARRGWVG